MMLTDVDEWMMMNVEEPKQGGLLCGFCCG